MAVSGVLSSWASSEVSRCSDRIAIATRSRRPSSVAPSWASSLAGGPSSKRWPRSCSLQSVARSAIWVTGLRAWEVTRFAIHAEIATARTPMPKVANRAYISERSYGVVSWLTTTTPRSPAEVLNGTPRRRRFSLALTLRAVVVVASSRAASRASCGTEPATSRPSWSYTATPGSTTGVGHLEPGAVVRAGVDSRPPPRSPGRRAPGRCRAGRCTRGGAGSPRPTTSITTVISGPSRRRSVRGRTRGGPPGDPPRGRRVTAGGPDATDRLQVDRGALPRSLERIRRT